MRDKVAKNGSKMVTLHGIAASPGIAIGKAFLFSIGEPEVPMHSIGEDQIESEIKKFESALEQTIRELEEIKAKTEAEIPGNYDDIFNAHILLLKDPLFFDSIIREIREGNNAAYAVKNVASGFVEYFSHLDSEYMRARVTDIKDVSHRLIQNLIGERALDMSDLKEKVIIVAQDLSPSDTALMDKEDVIGFATNVGSRTSHTTIMARALKIPAVVGLGSVTSHVKSGDLVIIDGGHGIVIVNPDDETLEKYVFEQKKFQEFEQELEELCCVPATTIDGYGVKIACNIEVPEEIDSVLKYGAYGVGLYRTEYMYIRQGRIPSEEEQYRSYSQVVAKLSPSPVIIRTLDLGGDKFASHLQLTDDVSSMMGLRAIRLCLKHPDIFLPQLKAILRASAHGNVMIMFPMVSSIEELYKAKELLDQAKRELRANKIPFNEEIKVGIMIEIPSAAITADILAKEVDFFSIGTNDLIQYTLAVHRVNSEVAHLYEPLSPAVLRLIQMTVDAAHNAGIWVGLCGEMAGDPLIVPLLIGMGLDELSVSPGAVLEVKRIVRSISLEDAQNIKDIAMSLTSAKEIEKFVYEEAMNKFPEVLAWINNRTDA